jgi:hypothetical protein
MNYFGYDNWFIIVDSDEFLIYNNCENMNINDLIEKFENNKILRAKALMLKLKLTSRLLLRPLKILILLLASSTLLLKLLTTLLLN